MSSTTLIPTALVTAPLSAGDIVGRALRIFRVNIKLIARILLLPTIILCLGRVAVAVSITGLAKGGTFTAVSATWGVLLLLGVVLIGIGLFYVYIRQLCLVRLFTGYAETYESAHQFVKNRFWTLLGLGLVWTFASIVLIIFWSIEIAVSVTLLPLKGMAAGLGWLAFSFGILGMLASLIFAMVVSLLVVASMAIDSDDLGALILHSLRLSGRSFGRALLFLILSYTTISLLNCPLSLPMVLLMGISMFMQGLTSGPAHLYEMPIYYQVISCTWETLINMILGPICYICYGLFYCDLRMRQEGTDLLARLNKLEKEAEPTA